MDPIALKKWFKENGDNTYRLNYDLNVNSIVFDAGGYEGSFANNIVKKYNCYVYIFEPVSLYYNRIKDRFKDNKKVKVFNFGLSSENKSIDINVTGDSSSTHRNYKNEGKIETIKLVSTLDFIKNENIKTIDLFKINIEGEEFPLLESLIKDDAIKNIKNLQVQFHQWVENSVERRDKIRDVLKNTHKLTYDFTFVWENWQLK